MTRPWFGKNIKERREGEWRREDRTEEDRW
jgi:hypothetical protein